MTNEQRLQLRNRLVTIEEMLAAANAEKTRYVANQLKLLGLLVEQEGIGATYDGVLSKIQYLEAEAVKAVGQVFKDKDSRRVRSL